MDGDGGVGGPNRREVGDFFDPFFEGHKEVGKGAGRELKANHACFAFFFEADDNAVFGSQRFKVRVAVGSGDALPEERRVIASN